MLEANFSFMGPHVLAMIQSTADTEFLANRMGLKQWQELHPCDFCTADSIEGSSYNFSDFRPDSKCSFPRLHGKAAKIHHALMRMGDNLPDKWRMLQCFRLRRRQGALFV